MTSRSSTPANASAASAARRTASDSPRRGSSRREARVEREQEARRADVIQAAATVFTEKGYEGAQINEIAAAAEVSLASLYRLFRGKEEIYDAVIQEAAEQGRELFRRRLASIEDPRERLLSAVDMLCECFDAFPGLRIALQGSQGLPWRIRARMGSEGHALARGFRSRVRDLCSDAVHQLGLSLDPDALASLLIGGVSHAAARVLDERPDARAQDAAPAVRELFERLLAGARREVQS